MRTARAAGFLSALAIAHLAPAQPREMFPLVRVDVAARTVEFTGSVPVHAHDPETPDVYLELIACTRDTREHESLVVTDAKPSHVHAALLLIGLEPGAPGAWTVDERGQVRATPPTGPEVIVEFITKGADGAETVVTPEAWVRNARTGERFPSRRMIFAGSRIIERQGREWYDADGAGTLIGLTTFGSETLAWPDVISHEAAVEEPVWVADPRTIPTVGTDVVVRLRPAQP